MMTPVPIISFDNVLPALAIVLISWGLRLRDGLMLLVGYLVTLVAAASVLLLWWGGSAAVDRIVRAAGLAGAADRAAELRTRSAAHRATSAHASTSASAATALKIFMRPGSGLS